MATLEIIKDKIIKVFIYIKSHLYIKQIYIS